MFYSRESITEIDKQVDLLLLMVWAFFILHVCVVFELSFLYQMKTCPYTPIRIYQINLELLRFDQSIAIT